MDKFTKAYIEAALWSSTDDFGNPLDENFGIKDLPDETRIQMENDCRKFQTENKADLKKAYGLYQLSGEWTVEEQAGHDFWLTRNGHGSGFWDRGLGDVGGRLSEASRKFGNSYLYVGDDKRLYV